MEDFWIVVACIFVYPLLYIACIYLPFIFMNIIGFFAKILDYFKDDSTSPKSTYNPPKNQENSETIPDKKKPPEEYVGNYLPPKETKNIVTPAEPVSFDSPPPSKQPEFRCDSFGNINSNATDPPKNSKIPAFICGTILVAFLIGIVVLIITQIETPEPPEPHVHEYVNGQCSCLSFDESYCEPIYQEIHDIMETMNTPIEDLVTIQSKLELLPIEYMGVKSITAQCYVLYRQCSIIRNEALQKNPDYEKMQSAFFTLLDKKDLGSYDSWNMYNILYSFLDNDLYATGEELWALLYGTWESSSGHIYFSFDGEYVSTNISHPLSNNADYYFYSDGYEMYISSSDNNTVFKFFSLNYFTPDEMRIYISSSNSYITFTRK